MMNNLNYLLTQGQRRLSTSALTLVVALLCLGTAKVFAMSCSDAQKCINHGFAVAKQCEDKLKDVACKYAANDLTCNCTNTPPTNKAKINCGSYTRCMAFGEKTVRKCAQQNKDVNFSYLGGIVKMTCSKTEPAPPGRLSQNDVKSSREHVGNNLNTKNIDQLPAKKDKMNSRGRNLN